MKVAVIDDYQNAFRTLACASKLAGHDLVVVNRPLETEDAVVDALKDAEAVILTMQRTAFPRRVLERLPKLKMISQTGRNTSHLDLAACTERGIVVSAGGGGGATATAALAHATAASATRAPTSPTVFSLFTNIAFNTPRVSSETLRDTP